MDNNEAKQILELSDNFSQLELLQSYKKNVEKLYRSLDSATINNEVTKFANDIYDNSNAYLALRELNMNSDTFQNQPQLFLQMLAIKIKTLHHRDSG